MNVRCVTSGASQFGWGLTGCQVVGNGCATVVYIYIYILPYKKMNKGGLYHPYHLLQELGQFLFFVQKG